MEKGKQENEESRRHWLGVMRLPKPPMIGRGQIRLALVTVEEMGGRAPHSHIACYAI